MARSCAVVILAVCCLVTGSNAGWLNSPCKADSDCPAAKSTCFEGLCLCTPGYYYSVGQNTCVRECAQSDIQKTFLKYPHSFMAGYTLEFDRKASEEDCQQWCNNVPKCRSVVYAVGPNVCFLQNVTALDIPSDSWYTRARINNYYQPMCA